MWLKIRRNEKKLKLLSKSNELSQSKENSESKEDDDSHYVPTNYNNTSEQKQIRKKERELMRAIETHEQSVALGKKKLKIKNIIKKD